MFEKLLKFAALGWLISYAGAETVSMVPANSCIQCLCLQESGCQPLGCRMDVGSLSCGYFLIKLAYYIDCGKPGQKKGQSDEDAWKACSKDYDCSVRCVDAYYERYKHHCTGLGMGTCEVLVRNHYGGPFGCERSHTTPYWNGVQQCCQCT